jgi:hypothetical protein
VASFIGYLPAQSPQVLCLVVVDSPQTDGRWGNTVAGPVFNAICVEAARYLGIPPTASVQLSAKDKNQTPAPSVLYAADLKAEELKEQSIKGEDSDPLDPSPSSNNKAIDEKPNAIKPLATKPDLPKPGSAKPDLSKTNIAMPVIERQR